MVLGSHLGRPNGQARRSSRSSRSARGWPSCSAATCCSPTRRSATARARSSPICATARSRCSRTCASSPAKRRTTTASRASSRRYADVYVNDAFGTAHRAHASTAGMVKFVAEKGAGLPDAEGDRVPAASCSATSSGRTSRCSAAPRSPTRSRCSRPCSGASTRSCIGGAMANTFLKAQGGDVGKSRVEEDKLPLARNVPRARPSERKVEVLLPVDVVVGDRARRRPTGRRCAVDAVPADQMALDIGPETAARLRRARSRAARTVFWNGPMGVFEKPPFAAGTLAVAQALAACKRADRGRRRRLGGGGQRGRASPTRSRTSRPAAAPRSSSSRARRCPASRRWRSVMSAHAAHLRQLEAAQDHRRVARAGDRDQERGRARSATSRWRWRRCSPRCTRWPSGSKARPWRSRRRTASGRTRAPGPARSRPSCSRTSAARYVIIGHSERRQHFGELDAAVQPQGARRRCATGSSRSCASARRCDERDAGETFGAWSARQLAGGLAELDADDAERAGHRLRAGVGHRHRPHRDPGSRRRRCTPSSAGSLARTLRRRSPRQVRIQYGGSVKPDNAATAHGAARHRRRAGGRRVAESG